MWQSTTVTLNDSTVPPGLPLPECCVVPPLASQAFMGKKRLRNEVSFEPPCDSDDDSDSTASSSFKSLDDFAVVMEESTTENAKKRRRVTFGERTQVAHVERIEKTCWYSRRDLFTMKSEAKRKSRELNLDSTLAPAYGMPLNNRRDEASLPGVVSSKSALRNSLSRINARNDFLSHKIYFLFLLTGNIIALPRI